ncbi:hypothetical protein BCR32DRAFT_308521 [Anaeromyces robustus]|uniref:Uncharacterized protein n=1 Tax=Anaeromyces robustus TaxID=1754192 RepID=A0A1Y1XBW8_9FUNG|nr:hypothetical protein BCR32DRAFT_308521 [Anaeromyces robustus]|eukprot:ORX83212.1 hypothetical protein BCR32DRAFT_308521 [Anaeromyces robustus]
MYINMKKSKLNLTLSEYKKKINIEIFLLLSTILMRKYHNIIKQNILNKYRGTQLDIETGNGGDIHKWKHFCKIICVEPDHEKIKVLNERISKSEIRNRISILQNIIQNIKLNNTYDVIKYLQIIYQVFLDILIQNVIICILILPILILLINTKIGINNNHVKEIFKKYGFKLLNEYTIDTFPFLDKSQILYTSNIKIIEISIFNLCISPYRSIFFIN